MVDGADLVSCGGVNSGLGAAEELAPEGAMVDVVDLVPLWQANFSGGNLLLLFDMMTSHEAVREM